jgi:uncharacterized SAM-binding protein YcdF (DUF218 family)
VVYISQNKYWIFKIRDMFFFFSKILLFIFSPIIWIFSLLIWAIFTKKPKRRRNLLIFSVVVLYLFSNAFLFNEAMRSWEMKQSHVENNGKVYDYVIVLGGITSYYDQSFKQIGFNRSVDRLMQAIKLYKLGKVKKIVFTGGDTTILQDGNNEADVIKQYLFDIGIPAEDLIFENESRNTHENATFVFKLLKPTESEKILLITSAFHMKRALGCFRKAGMNPDYFVADRFSGERKFTPDNLLVPGTQTLDRWNLLIHELSGFAIYKIMGYN